MSKPVQTEKGPVKRRFRDKEIEECQGHRKVFETKWQTGEIKICREKEWVMNHSESDREKQFGTQNGR